MKKILVVDSREHDRLSLMYSLQSEGFCVITSDNGVTALELAKAWLPNLVICETQLQGIDGYDVLGCLRREPLLALTPFVFLTTRCSPAELRKGMNLGADDYLIKPFIEADLFNTLKIRIKRYEDFMRYVDPEKLSVPRLSEQLPTTHPQLWNAMQFIVRHYREPISLRDVSQAIGYSSAYLTDLMQRETGRSINVWITHYRMAEARCLLLKAEHSIDQVAALVGYQDTCHFIKKFRQLNGLTPKVWSTTNRVGACAATRTSRPVRGQLQAGCAEE